MNEVTTRSVDISTYYTDTPMIVALLFALAGSFFVVLYYLRRRRK